MATTLYKLAEQALKIINAGEIQAASNVSFGDVRLSICQVINQLLKINYYSVNEKLGETIPNGTVIATYEGITPTSTTTGRSQAILPIKPVQLKRNIGIWSIYFPETPQQEFIPMQMGQMNLINSQPMINDLLGQVGYENKGLQLYFSKDLPLLYPNKTLNVEMAIMDVSEYDDYSPIPILPETEWQIIQEVVKLYIQEGVSDYLVDDTSKQQQNLPIKEQQQS